MRRLADGEGRDAGTDRGVTYSAHAGSLRFSLRSSVPKLHDTGIARPRCADKLSSHISNAAVSTVDDSRLHGTR